MSDDDFDAAGAMATAPAASAAMAWVQLLRDDNFSLAWQALTEDFRLALIQDWIVKNPMIMSDPARGDLTRDELAAELSVGEPTHPLWQRGAALVAERGLRNLTTAVLGDRPFGAGSRPRPMGPNLELIRIIPLDQLEVGEDGYHAWAPGQFVENATLLMENVPGGWKVAGAGGYLPRPGWPPVMETIVGPTD
jgi:hypothetical protein